MSESPGDGQPASGGPSQSNIPPQGSTPPQGSGGRPRGNGQGRANGQQGGRGQPPRDPVADFQRWLMKAGARSMANQVADQVKRTVGAERRNSGDVWDVATNELPPNEPPECQWCPVCQAARAARTGGAGGLGAQLANAGGVLASVVQDAFAAFEQVMKTQEQNRTAERPPVTPSRTVPPDHQDDAS